MKSTKIRTALAALTGLACGAALTMGGVAFAHGGKGPHGMKWTPEKIEEHVTEMTQQLSLSDTQEANVRTIFADAQTKAQALQAGPRSHEKMLAMRTIHFQTEDALYATLSCEQREVLRKLKREHRAERMDARWQEHQDQNR